MQKTIDGLMEIAHDPVIQARKELIYKYRELKLLGVRHIDQLDEENQKGLKLLYSKNIGKNDDNDSASKDESIFQGKLEKRELINTGRVFRDDNYVKVSKDMYIFTDKSKCQDIYLKTKIEIDKNKEINMYE